MAFHRRDMPVEPVLECPGGREGQKRGDARHAGLAVGQAVRLPVFHHLQPVLHAALEAVCRPELYRRIRMDVTFRYKRLQRLQRAASAKARIASAPNELLRLDEELDLPDAAPAELDIVPLQPVPARAARGVDLLLDRPYVLRRGEIEMAAPYEGLQSLQERFSRLDIACDRARLYHRRPFPVAPGGAVVVFRGADRDGGRCGARVGAQPEVGAEHVALRGLLAHDAHQLLRKPREDPLYAAPADIGRPVLVVEEDQVDIARIVEFRGAELPHAKREQARPALGVVGLRQRQFACLVQAPQQMPECRAQRRLRKPGERAGHPFQRPDGCNVGQRNGKRGAPLGPAQAEHGVRRRFPGEAGPVRSRFICGAVGRVRAGLEQQPRETGIGDQPVAEIGAVGEYRGQEPPGRRIILRIRHEKAQRVVFRLVRPLPPALPAGLRRLGIGNDRQVSGAADPISRQTCHARPIHN